MSDLSYSALMLPMSLLVVIPIGALLALRWRRLGIAIVLLASVALYLLSTGFVSNRLLLAAENRLPPTPREALAGGQAIVVLAGDIYHGEPGTGSADVGLLTLDRLRMAAALHRTYNLPILVTGASEDPDVPSDGALMAHALEEDYGIAPRWVEERAHNTWENAVNSAAILKEQHITKAIIVTQAWHLPRAVWCFEQAGIEPIAAPAERTYIGERKDWSDLFPDYKSYARSFYALHEMLGLAYYQYHYRYTDRTTDTLKTASEGAPP